jgi:hypothetical protein
VGLWLFWVILGFFFFAVCASEDDVTHCNVQLLSPDTGARWHSRVELVFHDATTARLPAPRRLGRLIGNRGFNKRAEVIWQEWWRHASPRIKSPAGPTIDRPQ